MKQFIRSILILIVVSAYNVVYADTTLQSTIVVHNGDDVSNWSHSVAMVDDKLRITNVIFNDTIYDHSARNITRMTTKHKVSMVMKWNHAELMQKQWVASVRANLLNSAPEKQRQQMEAETLAKFSMIAKSPRLGPKIEVKDMGKTDTIDGYKCTYYVAYKDGNKDKEYCVASWDYFPENEKLSELINGYSEFTNNVLNSFAPVNNKMKNDINNHIFRDVKQINGYPIVTRQFENDKLIYEVNLNNTSTRAVDKDSFTPPADYKIIDLYKLP